MDKQEIRKLIKEELNLLVQDNKELLSELIRLCQVYNDNKMLGFVIRELVKQKEVERLSLN